MPSVFLSYSQKDVEQAALLEQQLKSRSVSVWRDQVQVIAGQRWPKLMGEEIAKRDALLLLWSRNAADSNFVELEWTTALALKKEILPCTLDETPLPASLAAIQRTSCNSVSDAADEIAGALSREKPQADVRANTKDVIDKLARIRSTNVAGVLHEFRVVHGSVYQAGGDIYVGTETSPTGALNKWQAWIAIVIGILTAMALVLGIWHSHASSSGSPTTASVQQTTTREQPFAGSVWRAANQPVPGVKVSLLRNEKLLGSTTTDSLGRFEFRVKAFPEAEITIIAQKNGFQTDKRYATLGNTNFNFTMSETSK